MKVTKTYQRYQLTSSFGAICNDRTRALYIQTPHKDTLCASAAGEYVVLWNLRTSESVQVLQRNEGNEPVSSIAVLQSGSSLKIGVGYSDGLVHLFDIDLDQFDAELEAYFRAGRSQVSSMDIRNDVLVCASDSEISVLDLVSGSGSKLKGHRGLITRLRLMKNGSILLSSAQDTFIKLWDLKKLHCFATLTGHSGPVWDFALGLDDQILVTGSADSNLRVWKLTYSDQNESPSTVTPVLDKAPTEPSEKVVLPLSDSCDLPVRAEFFGSIPRIGTRRVHTLLIDDSGEYLICQSFDRNVELFRLLGNAAQTKRLRKKVKKATSKGEVSAEVKLEASDMIRPVYRITLPAKPTSCDILPARPQWKNGVPTGMRLRFLCALKNNSLEELEAWLPLDVMVKPQTMRRVNQIKDFGVRLANRIHAAGHRSPPIACSITSDCLGLFTLASSEVKLWNRHSTACLVTLNWSDPDADTVVGDNDGPDAHKSDYNPPTKASAMVLAPGDRHIVVGFETGQLLLFDVRSKSIRQTIETAHHGAVRALSLSGDKKGVLSGGSDKRVNFYTFDLKVAEFGPPTLCLVQSRDPQTVADQILCLAVSPNNRLVVIGLANFHVDIYFADSFKRIHSLYGHAAPVTSLDVSADSRLVITGSSDKTVRLWEVQFGNCQRRFTSHMEPVTSVRFIPHTSLAISADTGGQIRQWDVAKLREVTTLKGHHGAVTCLATATTNTTFLAKKTKDIQHKKFKNTQRGRSSHGEDEDDDDEEDLDDLCGGLIVSAGRDFTVRVWTESEELLILEEEAEVAREAAEDEQELVRSEAIIPGAMPSEASETGLLGRPTTNTRDAADMLMEAMDVYEEELQRQALLKAGKSVQAPHPLLTLRGGLDSPDRFLLNSLTSLRAPAGRIGGGGAGLEHALGTMTTEHARRLLPCLTDWLSRGWEIELVGRAIRHLVTLHYGLVVTSVPLRDMLEQSREARRYQLRELKSLVGMNIAGLEYMKRNIEDKQQVALFEELWSGRDKRLKKQKSKRNRMALLLPG